MNSTEAIIEKIRALLRLAKSDNPHEAALAMERAAEIASKHQLDLADIGQEDDLHKIISRDIPCPVRLAHEWKQAVSIVQTFFHVNALVLTGRSKVKLIGTELDIEIADYICTYLIRACRGAVAQFRNAEKAARRKTTGAKITNFIDGFFNGVAERLYSQRASQKTSNSQYAVILANGKSARDEWSTDYLGGRAIKTLGMPSARRNDNALYSGLKAGRQTQINPGLRGSPSLALP